MRRRAAKLGEREECRKHGADQWARSLACTYSSASCSEDSYRPRLELPLRSAGPPRRARRHCSLLLLRLFTSSRFVDYRSTSSIASDQALPLSLQHLPLFTLITRPGDALASPALPTPTFNLFPARQASPCRRPTDPMTNCEYPVYSSLLSYSSLTAFSPPFRSLRRSSPHSSDHSALTPARRLTLPRRAASPNGCGLESPPLLSSSSPLFSEECWALVPPRTTAPRWPHPRMMELAAVAALRALLPSRVLELVRELVREREEEGPPPRLRPRLRRAQPWELLAPTLLSLCPLGIGETTRPSECVCRSCLSFSSLRLLREETEYSFADADPLHISTAATGSSSRSGCPRTGSSRRPELIPGTSGTSRECLLLGASAQAELTTSYFTARPSATGPSRF